MSRRRSSSEHSAGYYVLVFVGGIPLSILYWWILFNIVDHSWSDFWKIMGAGLLIGFLFGLYKGIVQVVLNE